MSYSDYLSRRIIELLNERDWSVRKVANRADMPYSSVNKIVLKERENPSILTVHSIAKAFGMSISEFLDCDYINALTSKELKVMRNEARNKENIDK